ncbi:MAG TPA: ABC transporter permease [Thermoanaerobaculia bacterium]|jgi:putative ABC transport system permease protein|nr:ABC transporter permease [Thermoanaerobaculia bacterium]
MSLFKTISARLHGLLQREAVIGDIDEEMRLHLQMVMEENVERGMPPEEARRAALRSFGNLDKNRERAWEVRGGGVIEAFLQDVRYGARLLARHRGFTAVAVLTLGLGIGANTAIFSVVNELLLRPLPFPGAERIVMLWEVNPEGREQNNTSSSNFRGWREQSSVFESLAAFTDQRVNLTGDRHSGGEPEEVPIQLATPELFRVLGVKPILGRDLRPEDALPDAPNVAVVSHGFWQRRLAGDPQAIGRSILLNGRPTTVVGVLPPGFQWHIRHRSVSGRPADIWLAITLPTEGPAASGRFLSVVGRLKPGVSYAEAEAEVKAIRARFERDFPDTNKNWNAQILPLREQFVGNVRPALLILLGAVGFVLLIACANVANLLLSRAAAREKEIVLRTALGAGRLRVVRQLLTESLLLAGLGCLLGLVIAGWGVRALAAISPRDLVNLQGVGLDLPVLVLTVAVSLVTGIVFGLAPALEATRLDLNESLKEGGKGAGGQSARGKRMRSALVVAEVALALVLLAGAGLLVKSFARLQAVDPGFEADNVLTLVVPLAGEKYQDDRQIVAFFRAATQRIGALPGVRAVGIVNYLPFYGGQGTGTDFTVEGRPAPAPGEAPATEVRIVDPGYFPAMGIPLLRGRNFTDFEAGEARHVVLVNEAMARQHFPGENPIGKRITVNMAFEPVPTEIVGIVGDVKHESLLEERLPAVYMPLPEVVFSFMTFVIRTTGDPADMAPSVRRTLRAIDPNQPVSAVRTMNKVMADTLSRARFNTLLLGLFAGLATLLSAIGIFGVMNYSVTLRTREIGLRIALGAQPREVLRLILKQGFLLTSIGVGIGLAGALALTRVMSGLLFGVGSTDPATFAAIVLLLTLVSLIACYIPARRATRVDPLAALRYDR